MAWPEHTVVSWGDFIEKASVLRGPVPSASLCIMRGQSDAGWHLQTSLSRCLGNVTCETAINIESTLGTEFFSQVHIHDLPEITNTYNPTVSRWALMQHYNAPTRLMDWTSSPYVAAYFAAEQNWGKDGAVWYFMPSLISPAMPPLYKDGIESSEMNIRFQQPDAPELLREATLLKKTDRMVAQQGLFTVSTNVLAQHDIIIDRVINGGGVNGMIVTEVGVSDGLSVFGKLIIPAALKRSFLIHLRSANVTANSLFPGIDGLGRSVTELARLSTARFPSVRINTSLGQD